jgi:molybdopterin/thiamine biosynthesis adenylyltransferase
MSRIDFPGEVFQEMKEHLHDGPGESFGFLLAAPVSTARGKRFCVRSFHAVDDEEVRSGHDVTRRIPLSTILEIVNRAKRRGLAVLEVHNHPCVRGGVRFSPTDEEGFRETVPYMLDALDGRPYGALVVGRSSVDARYWEQEGLGCTVRKVTVAGETLQPIRPTTGHAGSGLDDGALERLDRQISVFGREGQRRLGEMRIAVVGLGGLGSHVVQQLSHAGVRSFVLVDDDVLETSNLNRLIGATPEDVGRPKTVVAERQINRVAGSESPDLTPLQVDVSDPLARWHLATADLVIGCVDNDGARLLLNQIAKAYGLPYLDLASGIHVSGDGEIRYAGGRIALVTPDGPCLNCMDEIDRREAQYFLSDEEVREQARERGYTDGWELPDPSVVGLNGTVASMAVDRVLEYVTGLDTPPELEYYYMQGERQRTIRTRRVERDAGCYTCSLGTGSVEPLRPGASSATSVSAGNGNNGGLPA